MNESFKKFSVLFEKAFNRDFSSNKIKETLVPYLVPGTILTNYKKNNYIIHSDSPVNKLYVLLKGTYQIEKYGPDGKRGIIECSDILLGLYEILNGDLTYGAYVRCKTSCMCLEIDASLFKAHLQKDIIVSNIALYHLAELIKFYMIRSEQHIVLSNYQFFIQYLYQMCEAQTLPLKIQLSRQSMADALGINLRTIYRYIKRAATEQLLTQTKDALIIDQEQYIALEECFMDFGL